MGLLDWFKALLRGRPADGVSPFLPGTGPARLLVLRHGEKTGEKRDKNLSPAGYARADKLASYIPQTFGKPDFLVAASNSVKSVRPYETLQPLAKSLGLEIFADIDDEDNEDLIEVLATDPRFKGKFGVISWRHANISDLIRQLGTPGGSFPADWNAEVYDLSIEIKYTGAQPAARQIKQPF